MLHTYSVVAVVGFVFAFATGAFGDLDTDIKMTMDRYVYKEVEKVIEVG